MVMEQLYKCGAVRDEVLFLMPNNQLKHLEFTSKLHSVDGYNMTIFRNVSERYQMEKELRRVRSVSGRFSKGRSMVFC